MATPRAEERAERVVALEAEYGRRLEAFARGLVRDAAVAADVVQVTLIRALERIDEVEPGREAAWLFRVARNEAINTRRNEGRETRAVHRKPVPPPVASPELAASLKDERERVRQAVLKLPERDQRLIAMRTEQDLTFREIAEHLEVPLGTVLSRMHRLTEKLRSRLDVPPG